ncbi:MAG: M4 family metallopeptidase [Burkholderiaceae bacterium]
MHCSANHHHSIFCILSPGMLHNVASKGTAQQRDWALHTLESDHGMRLMRATYQLMETGAHKALLTASPPVKQRTIYDAKNGESLPGKAVRTEGGKASSDVAVNEAYDGLGATFDFYQKAYSRNSIDDEGLHLDATVHYKTSYDNAFWNGQQMVFGDGDGSLFNRFTIAVDVIGHELTHGVTGDEVNLVYLGESGALNESVSDVFGSLVKQFQLGQTADKADWLIGAGLLAKGVKGIALRSMKAPGTAYDDPVLGKDDQPGHMRDYVHTSADSGGVHTNSGIPNHAFFLAATAIGGNAWAKTGRIWYETVRDKQLKKTADFRHFAQRTVINAAHLFGQTEKAAILKAWSDVGVNAGS